MYLSEIDAAVSDEALRLFKQRASKTVEWAESLSKGLLPQDEWEYVSKEIVRLHKVASRALCNHEFFRVGASVLFCTKCEVVLADMDILEAWETLPRARDTDGRYRGYPTRPNSRGDIARLSGVPYLGDF